MTQWLVLDTRRFARLRGAVHLHVAAGTLWLTIDRLADDVVLGPGQGLRLPPRSRVLIQARDDAPARVCVRRSDPWWRRVVDALRSARPVQAVPR